MKRVTTKYSHFRDGQGSLKNNFANTARIYFFHLNYLLTNNRGYKIRFLGLFLLKTIDEKPLL